ncbi:MAG: glucokinase [Chloroflexota bacterium]|nr:glucokinase [Chloroflexota bacterium]
MPTTTRRAAARRAPLVAGVDLGGTKIQTVLMRGEEVVGKGRELTPQGGAEDVTAAIVKTMDTAAAEAGATITSITGVGIGFPGTVEGQDGTVVRAVNLPMFEGFALGRAVAAAVGGAEVRINNDVSVAVVGEQRLGAGRPYRDFIGVFVGTGVGGGLVLEGSLRDGRGAAGEIGHMVVKPNGRRCGCGRRGCLEAYAGRLSMERTARRWVKRGRKTVLFDLMEARGRDHLASGVIAKALANDDRMARRLVDDGVAALGVALASAQNLLDVEAFVIGGGLGDRLGKPFVARIERAMKPHLLADKRPPKMLLAELGDLSGAIGAALIATPVARATSR